MNPSSYTFAEAATRLCKSERTIHEYAKKGFLKKKIENGRVVLNREEVELLAVDVGVKQQPVNRKTVFKLQARLTKVEEEMRAVKHALELRDAPPLRPDANTCSGLLLACTTYLNTTDRFKFWTTSLIDQWTDLFERMDEETLDSFISASSNPQAWVPLFRFCTNLMGFCWENDRQIPSLLWQARAGRLETARQRLRGVIILLVEMGGGTAPLRLLDTLGSPRENLINRIASGT